CFGNEVARVSAGFVDHFLTVGHGVGDVLECLDNRSVESHSHNVRRYDANAAAPTVQHFLRLGLDAFLHGDPPAGQYLIDGRADDRLGQHALGDGLDVGWCFLDLKEEIHRIADDV